MKMIIAHIHGNSNNGVCTGHFVALARMYVTLFKKKCKVLVAGGPLYLHHFSEELVLTLPYCVSEYAKSYISLAKMLVNSWVLFKNTKGDTVIIQDGKPLSNHICILLCYRKCNLYLIKYNNDGIDTTLKRCIYSMIRNRIKGIICPNKAVGEAHRRPYCVVPDYIYTGINKNNKLSSLSEKKYDFCCLGRIVPEKGIVEVARKLKNTPCRLLIAGNPNPSELAEELYSVCKDAHNIDLKLGYLDEEEYEKALNSSKYAILNYQGVYANRSSGVVYDMIFHDIPVIGKRCGGLQFIEDLKMGILYDDIGTFDFELATNNETYSDCIHNINCYCAQNEQYKQILSEFIRL